MIKNLIARIKPFLEKYHLYAFKDVALFIIIILVFHVLYKVFARNIYSVDFISNSAGWLAYQVYLQSKWFLELIGANVTAFEELTIGGYLRQNVFYYAEINGYVSVNRGCSGLKQFYQLFFLFLLYPGPWKHKIWFIPMGILIIHLVNVFRILSMVYVTIHLTEHWDFIHDWVLRPFFYVVMFFLWVWWNEKFYQKNKKVKQMA